MKTSDGMGGVDPDFTESSIEGGLKMTDGASGRKKRVVIGV